MIEHAFEVIGLVLLCFALAYRLVRHLRRKPKPEPFVVPDWRDQIENLDPMPEYMINGRRVKPYTWGELEQARDRGLVDPDRLGATMRSDTTIEERLREL